MIGRWIVTGAVVAAAVSLCPGRAAAQSSAQDLRRLSLQDLMKIEVTTVTRTPQPSAQAPAAVFVLTRDDIRRSGARAIPDVLRLVPGLQVARIDANKWAVGIRGFADRLARAVLVLIDGRAVYSPLFAGTYWEVQDTPLDDIDRIEVIRGPGGTLWGANAVSGVINIITRDSRETTGVHVNVGGGTDERASGSVRVGGTLGAAATYRVYARAFDRGPEFHAAGNDYDGWQMGQAGFRADIRRDRGILTLSGDTYRGSAGQRAIVTSYAPPFSQAMEQDARLDGANLVARWQGTSETGSHLRLQAFFDHTRRREVSFDEARNTFDLDYQQSYGGLRRQQITWGAEFRVSDGATRDIVPTLRFIPASRTDTLWTAFAQDEVQLVPERVILTVGSKVERNQYSGFEAQPSVRVAWTPAPDHTLVASVARAVRTPSRVEQDLEITTILNPSLPMFLRLVPNADFVAERLTAYEAGYRVRPLSPLYITASAFLNHHQDVLSTETSATVVETTPLPVHLVLPLKFANGLHGNSHGLELTADARIRPWWRWTAAYALLRIQLTRDAGSGDVSQERRDEGGSPRHQATTTMSFDFGKGWEVDGTIRYVSRLPAFSVPAYTTGDLRLGWQPRSTLEFAISGRDLFAPHHLEFTGGAPGDVPIQRSVFAGVTWRR